MMRVHVVGGFLGAGKTTLIRTLARNLAAVGEQVAIVTNDQGKTLVDTSLCRSTTENVTEIVGGCFCCRYDELEAALLAAAAAGATVALAEAVGSCTDLVATVLSPLAARLPDRLNIAPLAVVVDPWRVEDFSQNKMHPDVAYLFSKQIEEADIVLVSRIDLAPPDVKSALRDLNPHATVLGVSGATGEGVGAWMATRPDQLSAPLDIDYDRYAAAEALLGWCNAKVSIDGKEPFQSSHIADAFLRGMAHTSVAHLKLTGLAPSGGRAALVRGETAPSVDFSGVDAPTNHAEWLINARIEMSPDALVQSLKNALAQAATPATVVWNEVEAFRPSRPTPTHRYNYRCGTGDEAGCCAAFYDRADVRALLGDSWHPGGVDLTFRMAEHLDLREGTRLLDVACGSATSLRALLEKFPILATGMDAQARIGNQDRLAVLRGDVHAIPFERGAFDAVLCECALSTFVDQPVALGEISRVLRKGGRLAISDMAVEKEIPASLQDWVHTGTCLSRAMTSQAYAALLEAAGFRIVRQWDESGSLRELLRRIKKNLVGAAFAAASGSLGGEVKIDFKNARNVIKEAERAIDDKAIGYTCLIAEQTHLSLFSSTMRNRRGRIYRGLSEVSRSREQKKNRSK